jgi:two-component system LytT family sensor kinase
MTESAARRRSEAEPTPERGAADAPAAHSTGPRVENAGRGRSGRPRWTSAATILLVWTGVAFFIATQRYLRGPSLQPRLALPWAESLGASFVTAYIWALLTPAAMGAARRWRPRRAAWLANGLALTAAGVTAALLHLLATNLFWMVADRLPGRPDFVATFVATLSFGGAARFATFAGIVGVTWGMDDFHTYKEKELQASELERELAATQLEGLKLRLHPPFLFNTLSTILPLIRSEPSAAARTVVQLGDILRLALHNDAKSLVPLETELDYIRLYLQIEQTRLRDRLEVAFAIEPEALDAAVPNLVLLPLCEGAIANGASARPGRARVEIRARRDGLDLRLEVDEAPVPDVPGASAAPIDDAFVQKTRLRLDLLYPDAHSIDVSDRLGRGHRVSVTLPYSAPWSEGTLLALPVADAVLSPRGAA